MALPGVQTVRCSSLRQPERTTFLRHLRAFPAAAAKAAADRFDGQRSLSLCGALQNLANEDSKYLVKLANVAMDSCQDCEEECKKHADKHEACKRRGEACAACYKECKQLAS